MRVRPLTVPWRQLGVADLNEERAERMRQFEIFVAELAVRSAFFRSFSLHVHVGCRPRQRVTSPYLSVDVAFPDSFT
jgi:hypothetical protein